MSEAKTTTGVEGFDEAVKSGWSTNGVIVSAVIGLAILYLIRTLLSKPKKPVVLKGAGAQTAASSSTSSSAGASSSSSSSSGAARFLDSTRQSVKLTRRENVSHDTIRLRFDLPSPTMILGLPVGKHFKVYAPNNLAPAVEGQWNGQPDKEKGKGEIVRSYTPVTSDRDVGYFELIVKVYQPNERFADGGKMSRYLNTLQPGDALSLSGPYGAVEYSAPGVFVISRQPTPKKRVGMIAGGTGITPMLQIIAAVLENPADTDTELWLLFANQTEQDILVRDYLERHQQNHPGRFHLWYTLDRPPQDWKYSQGFVNPDMIAQHLPAPGDDTIVLLCGPPPMIDRACKPALAQLGYPNSAVVAF